MGVSCEINFFKPPDGAYQPGQSIRGLIKYAVDEPTEFDKITISLKGRGDFLVTEKRNNNDNIKVRNKEVYIDLDNIIQDENNIVPVGDYEIKFGFNLPNNIPSSTRISKFINKYILECKIKYYIHIQFTRSGFFARNKRFRKEIIIISGVTPILLREPVMYGKMKKPIKLFSKKENIINLKVTVLNSIIPSGGKIELLHEVENSSSTLVESVKIKLIEMYRFYSDLFDIDLPKEKVPESATKTSAVKCGDTQIMTTEINVPFDLHSLEYSNIVSREYQVRIKAKLPIPHRDIVLDIPVQIGRIDENIEEDDFEDIIEEISFDEPPPSYWEAMAELKKENNDDNSDDENCSKG